MHAPAIPISPRVRSMRSLSKVRHVWRKIMHYKLTLNPGCLSFPPMPKTIDRQVRKIERERARVEGCCKLIQIHARVSGVYVIFLHTII